jgi:hypothetical protein
VLPLIVVVVMGVRIVVGAAAINDVGRHKLVHQA